MDTAMLDKILEILKGFAALLTAFFIGKKQGEAEVDSLKKQVLEDNVEVAIDDADKKVMEESAKLSPSDALNDIVEQGGKLKNKT